MNIYECFKQLDAARPTLKVARREDWVEGVYILVGAPRTMADYQPLIWGPLANPAKIEFQDLIADDWLVLERKDVGLSDKKSVWTSEDLMTI